MPDRPRFYVRVYGRSPRGLQLLETLATADQAACLSAATALASRFAGAVAFTIDTDANGTERKREIGRYGYARPVE